MWKLHPAAAVAQRQALTLADPDKSDRDRGALWRQIGEYTGLALTLPGAGFIGYLIGDALDHHFGTGYLWTIIFLFLGCAAGLVEIVRVAGRRL